MTSEEKQQSGIELIRLRPRQIEVCEDDPFAHDALERKKLIEPLAQLLSSTPGPFVLEHGVRARPHSLGC